MADQAIMSLTLLEVSLGNYADALTTIEPLVARFTTAAGTEIVTAGFLPDAVEAMIALGRLGDAEPMIKALEHHGQRLHRPWILAVGARCRSMMLAAQGRLNEATRVAHQAMAAHQELAMPFERARTQLLLGQLQRRQRQKDIATTTLTEALAAFEEMNAVFWLDRTRNELARVRANPTRTVLLTPSEQRVAELAASGMTNRDIGAAVFISPKTVDAHLARIYRKLGIHSRAELGRVICQTSGRSSGQIAG
jgi:DNA-binding CsgD family transcriptional regulator